MPSVKWLNISTKIYRLKINIGTHYQKLLHFYYSNTNLKKSAIFHLGIKLPCLVILSVSYTFVFHYFYGNYKNFSFIFILNKTSLIVVIVLIWSEKLNVFENVIFQNHFKWSGFKVLLFRATDKDTTILFRYMYQRELF